MKLKFTTFLLVIVLLFVGLAHNNSTVQAAEVEQRSEFVAPIMIVNTSFLNVRSGPGAQYTVLITVVGGTELPVLGLASDRVWYQVSTVAGVGWVNSEFTIPRGDFTNVPILTQEDILDTIQPLSAGGVDPNLDFSVPTSDDSFANTGFSAGREWGISIIEPHPARREPTTNSTSPGEILAREDYIYTLIEAVTNEGVVWYRIQDPSFNFVWVEGAKTQFRPYGCGSISVVEFVTGVRPVLGPDGSGTLTGNLGVPQGEEAYLLNAVNQQYQIELIDGNVGWINAVDAAVRNDDDITIPFCSSPQAFTDNTGNVTSGANPNTARGLSGPQIQTSIRAIVNTGFLNIRSGPGAQFTVVSTVAGGTELAVLGYAPDAVWYLVEGTFGRGWLNSEFVLFRGDGSNLPIIRDFSQSTVAELARPTATITNAVTLYAAPDVTLGVIGALSGVQEDVPVVARTEEFDWVQLETNLGFGWVRTNLVTLQGDTSLIPIVDG